MYPYSCHEDIRFNDVIEVNDKLIRLNHNHTNSECSRVGRRSRNPRNSAPKSGFVKCKCSLMEEQRQHMFLDALVRSKSEYVSPNLPKMQVVKASRSCTSTRTELPPRSQAKKPVKKRCKDKELKIKPKRSENYAVRVTETPHGPKNLVTGLMSKAISVKQVNNKRNIQSKGTDIGKTGRPKGFPGRPMEVINEEHEEKEFVGGSNVRFESDHGKKAQESCADFLTIMHDTVLETVQKSVEGLLKDYFHHTMEKIDSLCSHMVCSDNSMSQMYKDIMDKIADQSEKSQFQFNTMCQCLLEFKTSSATDKTSRGMDSNNSRDNKKRSCHCSCGFDHGNNNPRKHHGSNGSKSLSLLKIRDHTGKRRDAHGSKRLNSSEQRVADCAPQKSSTVEKLVNGRGTRNSNVVAQFSNLASKNFKVIEPLNRSNRNNRNSNLYEQLSNLRLTDPDLADKLTSVGSIDPNLTDACTSNATIIAAEISKSQETISAILVEKLSNSRDAINSILAEKLKSDHNPSYKGDDQINYETKTTIYTEELRNIQNLIAAQRAKELEEKSPPTVQVLIRPTSQSELRQKTPVERRSVSQSDLHIAKPKQSYRDAKSGPSVPRLVL